MSITAGFTAEQIRDYVFEYERQRHGRKGGWVAAAPFSVYQLRRWQAAVYGGDLDYGLIARDSGSMSAAGVPRRLEADLDKAGKDAAEVERLRARVAALEASNAALEGTNEALGKAIGLLHQHIEQEPGESPTRPDQHGS